MVMGRPPKPRQLKVIAGNPGGRPLTNEPQAEGDLYAAPDWFNDEQKASWYYAIEHAPLGLLRLLDKTVLATWVIADVEIMTAEKHLQQEGAVILKGGSKRTTDHRNGEKTVTIVSPVNIINPWAMVRDKAFLRLMKATTELGFSPTSRARITLPGADIKAKDANRFANNVNRRAS